MKIVRSLPLAILLTSALVLGAVVSYFQVFQISDVQVEDWFTVSNQKIWRWDAEAGQWREVGSEPTIHGGDIIKITYDFRNDANRDVEAKHQLVITESATFASTDDVDIVKFKLWDNEKEDITESETASGYDYIATSSSYIHTAETEGEAFFIVYFNPWFYPQTVSFTVKVMPGEAPR